MVTIYSICILNILMTYLCMMATQMNLLVEVLVVGEIPTLDASPQLDGSFTNSSIVIFCLSPFLGFFFVLAIFMSTN